jgi:WD40 repeat protein
MRHAPHAALLFFWAVLPAPALALIGGRRCVSPQRKLSSRSDRVKSVDIHPTEPWVLSAMYNGHVFLWNYNTQSLVKSFEVSDQPVRAAKFVPRKQWIVAGADDMQIRIYNYNTMEKVKTFEAHSDYIRCITVHPSQPLMLTSSDDMTIRLWDWDKGVRRAPRTARSCPRSSARAQLRRPTAACDRVRPYCVWRVRSGPTRRRTKGTRTT